MIDDMDPCDDCADDIKRIAVLAGVLGAGFGILVTYLIVRVH